MNNLKTAILIIIVVALVATGVFYLYQKQLIPKSLAPSPASPTPKVTFQDLKPLTPTSAPQGRTLGTQPETGSNTRQIKNIGITIFRPQALTLVSSPVKVSGRANVLEGKVIVRIKDANGHILGQGETTACMDYDACPFETTVDFSQPAISTGTVEAFNPSSVDGSEKYLQSVTVRFE